MTVKNADRDAIRHGKITEQPLRERPGVPTWALKLIMAVTGLFFFLFVIGHMVGNLKIFMPDHGNVAAIDEYGEFLRSMGQPIFPGESLLWIIRIVLLPAWCCTCGAHLSCTVAPVSRAVSSVAPT